MKRFLFLAIAIFLVIAISAQKIKLVGTWNEEGSDITWIDRTWIFNADGTKTIKGRMKLTYPIGGVNCTFDLFQNRTDEKWTLNGRNLTLVAIPLNKFTIDVNYQKYKNYTATEKQKIKAGIPAFKQKAIKETRRDWQSFVGHKSTYVIISYTPKQVVFLTDGGNLVLNRDISKMTAQQKAEFEKDCAEYEAQIQVKFHDVEANGASGPVKSITTNLPGRVQTVTFSLDGKMHGEDIIDAKYDTNGYLLTVKKTGGQNESTITYKWENGKVISQSLDTMGQQIVVKYTYNEKGVPASQYFDMDGQDMSISYTDYKYDDHGNWISRKFFMVDEEIEETRIVKYYE